MIRLLLRLFNVRDYEVCQSCETLKQQLEYERAEKQKLTDTLLEIIRPKPVIVPERTVELQPAKMISTFSRRRAVLEEEDRKNAQTVATSENLGMPDEVRKRRPIEYVSPPEVKSTEQIEAEVGIQSKEKEA